MARPTAVPRMPASASGVSTTRSSPKSFCRPSVIRKTPPSRPMSSPMSTTLASSSMARRRPRLSALPMVSVSVLMTRLRPRSAPRSLSPASGRCPQHAAMLARASFSRWKSLPHARTHPLEQLAHRDGVLLAGAHVLQLADALGQVALADDDDVRGARPVRGLHRTLEPAPAVDGVGRDAGPAQLPDQAHGQPLGLLAEWDDEGLDAGRHADVEALGLHCKQRPVDADGVPDAGDVRTAE